MSHYVTFNIQHFVAFKPTAAGWQILHAAAESGRLQSGAITPNAKGYVTCLQFFQFLEVMGPHMPNDVDLFEGQQLLFLAADMNPAFQPPAVYRPGERAVGAAVE